MSFMQTIGSRIVLEGLNKYHSDLGKAERDTREFGDAVDGSSRKAGGSFSRMTTAIGLGALAAAAAVGGIGVASVKLAADFETTMSRIEGLTNTPASAIEGLREGILKMSTELGVSAAELGAGAYFILSSGITDTATAMEVLRLSAKAAASGLGDTQTVANALTGVMNAYQLSAGDAAKVTDTLINIIKLGKGEPAEFADTLSFTVPLAAQMGIEFEELGAILATLTNQNLNAGQAGQYLRGVMAQLLKPSQEAEEAFAALGLPIQDFRELVRNDFVGAMQLLVDKTGGSTEALATLFPNVEGLTAVMAAFANQGEATAANLEAIRNGTGALDTAFAAVQKTANFKLKKAMQSLNVVMIRTGAVILPGLVKGLDKVTPLLEKHLPLAAIYTGKVLKAMGQEIEFVVRVARFVLAPVGAFISVLGSLTRYVGVVVVQGDHMNDWLTHLPTPIRGAVQWLGELGAKVVGLLRPISDLVAPIGTFVANLDAGTLAAQGAALAIGAFLAALVVSKITPFLEPLLTLVGTLGKLAGSVVTFTIQQVTKLVGGAASGVVEGATAAGTELAGEALAIPKSSVLEMSVAHMSVQRMDVTPQITDKGDEAVKVKGKDLGGKFGLEFVTGIASAVGSFLAFTLGPKIGIALGVVAGSTAFAFGAAAVGGAIVGIILGTIVAGIAGFVIPGAAFVPTIDPAEIGRRVESQVLAPIASVLKGIGSFNLAGPGGLLSRLNDVFTEGLFNLPSVIAGAAAGIFLSLGQIELFLLRQLGHLEVSVANAIVGIAKAFDLSKIFRGAGDAPINIGKAAFRILEAIGEIELDLLNALGSLEVAVAKGIAGINLGKLFQAIFDAPVDIAVGLFRGFEFVGRAIVDGVIKGGLGRVKDLAKAFIEMFDKNVYQKVRSFFEIGSPSQLMARLGSDIIAGLLLGVVAAVPAVVAFFSRLGGRILGAVQALPSALVGIGRSLITGFASAVSAAWEGADDFFYGLPNLILDIIGDLSGLLLDVGQAIISGLFGGVQTLWDREKHFWSNLPGTVIRLIGDVSRTLYQLGDDILAGLFSGVRTVWERDKRFFSALPGNVLSLIGNLSQLLVGAGEALLGGLREGITTVYNGLTITLPTLGAGLATLLISGFKGAWNGLAGIINSAIPNEITIPGISVLGKTVFPETKIDLPDNPIPKLARGTGSFRGGLAVVGEAGPELAALPRGSRVWPHGESMRILDMLSGGIPGFAQGAGQGSFGAILNFREVVDWLMKLTSISDQVMVGVRRLADLFPAAVSAIGNAINMGAQRAVDAISALPASLEALRLELFLIREVYLRSITVQLEGLLAGLVGSGVIHSAVQSVLRAGVTPTVAKYKENFGTEGFSGGSFQHGGYVPAGQTGAMTASAPGLVVNISAPVNVTINEMNWARVRSVALAALDEALGSARSTAIRQGVPLSSGIS